MSPISADPTSFHDEARVSTSGLRQRRDVRTLSEQEMTALTDAFTALKQNGTYDSFTQRHFDAQVPVHRGPWFGPWHRTFLLELEDALRTIDSSLTVPYWRFEVDAGAGLFTDQGFGPDGDPAHDQRVITGPFANWHAFYFTTHRPHRWRSVQHRIWCATSAGVISPIRGRYCDDPR